MIKPLPELSNLRKKNEDGSSINSEIITSIEDESSITNAIATTREEKGTVVH